MMMQALLITVAFATLQGGSCPPAALLDADVHQLQTFRVGRAIIETCLNVFSDTGRSPYAPVLGSDCPHGFAEEDPDSHVLVDERPEFIVASTSHSPIVIRGPSC